MKKFLESRAARLQKKLANITERVNASEDVNEVRSLTAEAAEINDELTEIRAQIAELDAEERQAVPANATLVNPGAQSYAVAKRSEHEDATASAEYRNAFWKYATQGTPIPAELRAGTANTTADAGAAIPVTIMNEVINTVRKRYGNLYNKVRKTSIPGGVEIPVGSLQASFRWIT